MTQMMQYKYAKPTSIDSPTVGCLFQAREWKKNAWKGVKALRRRLREAGCGPYSNAGVIKLELIKAESSWREAMRFETDCLRAIEKRANELGLTTTR
jgi:hypothetical protein